MATFLLKTEPSEYSFDDLTRDKQTVWSGVRNPAALAAIRRARKGDEALIYHTGDERAVVGLAAIASDPYEDPKNPGKTDDGLPKSAVFDVRARSKLRTPVTLAAMRADKRFAGFVLLRQGRLSVIEVPPELDRLIRELGGLAK